MSVSSNQSNHLAEVYQRDGLVRMPEFISQELRTLILRELEYGELVANHELEKLMEWKEA
jgi:hypothetical protein